MPIDDRTDKAQLELLRKVLSENGIDYMVTRVEGTIAHVNIWVGKPGLQCDIYITYYNYLHNLTK